MHTFLTKLQKMSCEMFPRKLYVNEFRGFCLEYFVQGCVTKYISISVSAQTPWNLDFQYILVFKNFIFNRFNLLLTLIFRASELRQRPKLDIL